MSFIFYAQSIDDATLTYSATPETGYPVTNLQDRSKNTFLNDLTFASDTANLVIDLGAARACNYILLGNYVIASAENVTLTLQCNSSDSWPGTEALAATTITAAALADKVMTFNSRTYRYWRLVFTSTSGTLLIILLANIFLGTYFQLANMPELIQEDSVGYNTIVNEAAGGSRFGYIVNTTARHNLSYEFNYITESEKTNWNTFRDQIYPGENLSRHPFYFSPDSGTTLYYMRTRGIMNFEELAHQAYKLNLKLEQEL